MNQQWMAQKMILKITMQQNFVQNEELSPLFNEFSVLSMYFFPLYLLQLTNKQKFNFERMNLK